MSLDLYRKDVGEKISGMPGVTEIEPGAFDGFVRGTGMYAMREFARAGRSSALAVGSVVRGFEKLGELEPFGKIDTTLSDAVFKAHDEIFQRAVDYWTPKSNEVGVAAEVVGQLLATLPMVVASPSAAVAATGLGAAEDLVRKGVDPDKATAVGMVQGAGLGLGIWMPILGQNGWQRIVLGGAASNVAQGAVTRAASGVILEGTPAADDFRAFDREALTLDALLGLAFGTLVHVSPAQRAQGAAAWERLRGWAEGLKPSEVDAVITLRQAEHGNVEIQPGKITGPEQVEAGVQKFKRALEQTLRDERVETSDLPEPRVEPDAARWEEAGRRAHQIQREAEDLGKAYDLVNVDPRGAVNDPQVRLDIEKIGDIFVERGPAKITEEDGELQVNVGGFGLVKFIWRHGEKSDKAKESQIVREDITRAPEVFRDYEPIIDRVTVDGRRELEWQVARPDGTKIVYGVRRFSDTDGLQHLVTLFVNDRKEDRFLEKPLSPKRGKGPESPGESFKPSTGDTGPGTSSSSKGGQGAEGLSIRTEGPAAKPGVAEPPPPRSARQGEAAGPEAQKVDPLAIEADRVAAELYDIQFRVGEDQAGEPILRSARDYLEAARADAKRIREDVQVFEAAARCLLGGG